MFYIAGHEVRDSNRRGLPVDLNDVTDVRTYPLFRPKHARGAPRSTGGVIPTHPRDSPRRSPASECTRVSMLGIPDLIVPVDLRRYPET